MALIKCPECGKEISDKAIACIHCGCPINNEKYKIILLGYNTDTSAMAALNTVLGLNLDYENVMNILNNLPYKIAEYDTQEEMEKYVQELQSIQWGLEIRAESPDGKNLYVDNSNQIKCPSCGAKNVIRISTMSKVASVALFGLFSNKRTRTFHCNNCGYEW